MNDEERQDLELKVDNLQKENAELKELIVKLRKSLRGSVGKDWLVNYT